MTVFIVGERLSSKTKADGLNDHVICIKICGQFLSVIRRIKQSLFEFNRVKLKNEDYKGQL